MRRILAEEGLHTVGVLAWKNCRQLRIVKLPVSVVRIDESAFQGCYLLGSVDAPGCVDFGYRAFAECCSLEHISASGGDNAFVAATKLALYLFDSRLNLSSVTLIQALIEPGQLTPFSLLRDKPQGCFGSSRLRDLKITSEFHLLDPHACDNCKLLAFVDLSSTPITDEVPPTLRYIASKAFFDCILLTGLNLMPGKRLGEDLS